MSVRLLLIDNYDSFTYNLVQAFAVLGAEVFVHRNDKISVDECRDIAPTHIVISPGPGRPEQAGITIDVINAFKEQVPVLGVCLGHQALVQAFGGEIIHAATLMHGKTSMVKHDGKGVYSQLPNPFAAGRYHSLAANRQAVPDVFEVTATTDDGEIMGVRHKSLPLEGVQFHPESVLTPEGNRLMQNFLSFSANQVREKAS